MKLRLRTLVSLAVFFALTVICFKIVYDGPISDILKNDTSFVNSFKNVPGIIIYLKVSVNENILQFLTGQKNLTIC